MIFDTLDNLEVYRSLFPAMQRAIDIMDRAIPYDDGPGSYELDGVSYGVSAFMTDARAPVLEAESPMLLIMLEGEMLVSYPGEKESDPLGVLLVIEGRFVIIGKGERYRQGLPVAFPKAIKTVNFSLA